VSAARAYFPAMRGEKQVQPVSAPAAPPRGEPRWMVWTALLAGVVVLLPLGVRETGSGLGWPYVALATAVAVSLLIPAVSRRAAVLLNRLRSPSGKVKWVTAAVLFVVASRYFLLSASLAGRDLFPKFHDEFMY